MGIDKRKAKKGQWRISEKTIWILAFLGGACGGLVGMYIFRHKTKHPLFVYGLPILALLHFFTIFFVQQYFN